MVVGVGLIALSALSAIQALAIVFIVGRTRETDAFFISYSIYVPVALLGVSLRRTLVPVLGSPSNEAVFRQQASEVVGRVTLLALFCTVLLAGVAPVAGSVLDPSAAPAVQGLLAATLVILALSAAGQIYAGSIAAVLNAMQRFPVSISIYVGSSLVGVVTSVALMAWLGIIGAPIGLLSATASLVVGHLVYLSRLGIRPLFRWGWALQRRQFQLVGYMVAGVALTIAQQLGLVFALSAVTLTGGSATIYSYAYFVIGVMLNLSSVPLSVTILPRVVADLGRLGPRAVISNLTLVVPYVMVVLLPMLSAFAAYGKPVLSAVFRTALTPSNITQLYTIAVCLAPMAIAASVYAVAGSMLLARRQWWAAIVVSLVTLVGEAGLIYSASSAGVYAIAFAHGAGAVVGTVGLLVALFGREAPRVAAGLLRASWRAPALCLVFVVGPLATGGVSSLPLDVLLAMASIAAYCGLAMVCWPDVSRRFVDLAKSNRVARQRPPPDAPIAVERD
jgi:peptidoglycan biosynthesis protein MviN/MurJ (putative lipid II flippase)